MERMAITDFANSLAQEIAQRQIFDVNEIASMIKVRTNFAIRELMNEYTTESEKEYMNLVYQQSRQRVGSKEYIEFGYKLAALKHKKAAANRAANNLKRQDDYQLLKNFVIDKFGDDVYNEFCEYAQAQRRQNDVISDFKF